MGIFDNIGKQIGNSVSRQANMQVNRQINKTVNSAMNPKKPANPAGAKQAAPAADDAWTCECGKEGNTGKFCSECAKPRP